MSLKSTRDGFGEALAKLGEKNPDVVVVTANLTQSTRVGRFARRFPTRFFEIGVAEQNAAGIAAGLALGGKTVFLTSFACFSPSINWAQIRQSICLNQAKVIIVGSHGGLATGADGATHQALEDVAILRALPRMTIVVPVDYNQTQKAVNVLAKIPGPSYLRLTRPKTPALRAASFQLGEPQVLQEGKDLTLIGSGPILAEAISRPEIKSCLKEIQIINLHTIKPLDAKKLLKAIKGSRVITLEDHQKIGGLGSTVAEVLAESGKNISLTRIGVNDHFGQSAKDYRQLWNKYLLSPLTKALENTK